MEKKQALLLLVLVLVVSLVSFTLGVMVGRQGAERDLSLKQQAVEKVLVTKSPLPVTPQTAGSAVGAPVDKPQPESSAEEPRLTFYDNLAKESSAPLGSGINLPPQEQVVVAKPPITLPENPIVVKATGKATAVAPVSMVVASQPVTGQPQVAPQGSYAVQVGSFAAAVDAGKLQKTLLDKGYPAFTVEADLGKKGLWYRVRLGPYADSDAAKAMQQLVEKKDKIKGFISRQ
jgi:cell division septation protein DedD